jgi:hypothetical protein
LTRSVFRRIGHKIKNVFGNIFSGSSAERRISVFIDHLDYTPKKCYTIQVRWMHMLNLYVLDASLAKIPVFVREASEPDLTATSSWQTNWTSKYVKSLPNKVAL